MERKDAAKGAKGVPLVTPRLTALDGPRWIASAHVVGLHYYSDTFSYFLTGGMWTQYFFVMGGFLLAYVEMVKPVSKRPQLTQLQYLQKRLVTIYPLYIFSLVMLVCTVQNRTGFAWGTLPLHVFLLQAILPICKPTPTSGWFENECASIEFNSVCWFISCLIVYWLILRPLSRIFERSSLHACYAWLAGLWLWSIIPALLHSNMPMPYDIYVGNAMKQGPLGYIHVFVAGVVLARVFVLTAMVDATTGTPPTSSFEKLTLSADGAPLAFRFGCSLGYGLWAVFAVVFWWFELSPWSPNELVKLAYCFCHNGGIMPLMALVLLGGSVGVDPLATRIFQKSAFRVLGQLSYSQYLLQMPVSIVMAYYFDPDSARAQARLPTSPTKPLFLMVFPVVLLTSAFLAQRFIERPYSEWQRANMKAQEGKPDFSEKILGWIRARLSAARQLEQKSEATDDCNSDSGCSSDSGASSNDRASSAV